MTPAASPFELGIAIAESDIDQLGHVNNVTYVRWVQDAAVAHWRCAASAGEQERLIWVVLRHEIDYKHPAMPGDEILARTWVGSATRATFERFTEIVRRSDGRVLAAARTLWCPLDVHTRRPTAVSAEVRQAFSVELGD